MAWLTWRQHRAEALGGVLAVAAVAALLVALGLPMHHAFNRNGIAGCIGQPNPSQSCVESIRQFTDQYINGGGVAMITWLDFLPALVGVFIGAPLLAREFEQGTWRLAWTQAVPRTRWLAVKLVLLAVGVAALTAGLTALFTWYRGPLDQIQGRLVAQSFDFEGLAIPAYALFAFALGTLAGILTRRTVTAMAITLGGFLAVRLPVEYWLRPHYQHPVTLISNQGPIENQGPARTALQLSTNLVDSSGHVLDDAQTRRVLDTAFQPGKTGRDAYLQAHGYHWRYLFQPASRFWHFQLIEAALFVGLAAVLLVSAVWLLRRRVG